LEEEEIQKGNVEKGAVVPGSEGPSAPSKPRRDLRRAFEVGEKKKKP